MSKKTNSIENKSSAHDLLFGDQPLEQWADMRNNEKPWSLFKEAKINIDSKNTDVAIEAMHKIIDLPGLESRHYLEAHHFLNELVTFSEEYIKLYGVVVEVGMPDGCDVLAVYEDHKARYLDSAGKGIMWENPDDSLDYKLDHILALDAELLKLIGPWEGARPGVPTNGQARINLLTSRGLHFGQGAIRDLVNDPKGNKIMTAMFELMKILVNKSN